MVCRNALNAGRRAPGAYADVVLSAAGIGEAVHDDGAATGAAAGRMLLKARA